MSPEALLPSALGPGSRVRVIAPASPPRPADVARGVRALTRMGFEVELGELVRKVRLRGYFAGPDERRAKTVDDAFADPRVDGIVCAAGGFGSLRILPFLDFDVIAANPKPFVGFSDITALHVAFHQVSGIVTFHGMMANIDSDADFKGYNEQMFLRALTDPAPMGDVEPPPDGPLLQVVREGEARGALTGGNLSLVAATLGTPWEIDTRGRVLFLEEWREPPFTVDTLLTQLKLAGKLDDAAALVFGDFVDCDPTDRAGNLSVEEVIQDATEDLVIPVLYGLPAGHGKFNATLPMGVPCLVDGNRGTFRVDAPGVRRRSPGRGETNVVLRPSGPAPPAATAAAREEHPVS